MWPGSHDVASTLAGVAVLGYSAQLVEIEAVAALPWPTNDQSTDASGSLVSGRADCHGSLLAAGRGSGSEATMASSTIWARW